MGYLEPWPEHPLCGGCQRPATTSRFDSATRQSIIEHVDGSPACYVDGGNPFRRTADAGVMYAIKTEAEFNDWPKAEEWGQFVAEQTGDVVYLGYVRSPDGHRKIGRVPNEKLAVRVIQPLVPSA